MAFSNYRVRIVAVGMYRILIGERLKVVNDLRPAKDISIELLAVSRLLTLNVTFQSQLD